MANKYVAIVKDAVEHSEDDHDDAMLQAANALSGFVTDADRSAWFSESSRMTKNIKAMQAAVEKVFTPNHYVQIEPSGSAYRFTVREYNS